MNDCKTIWTKEQVQALNESQRGYGHPFTCGGERMDDAHKAAQKKLGGDFGELVATGSGWVCLACDYTQNYAHDHQFNGAGAIPRFGLQKEPPPVTSQGVYREMMLTYLATAEVTIKEAMDAADATMEVFVADNEPMTIENARHYAIEDLLCWRE